MRRTPAPLLCAAAWLIAAAAPAAAQSQLPRPSQLPPAGGQAQPQQPAPQAQQPSGIKPQAYKPVAISAPPVVNDPAFAPFLKQISDAAQRKDRAALAKLVVAKGFFWETEKGNRAEAKRSGIDNLSTALGLTDKDGFGWDALEGFASDPTGAPMPGRQGIVCSPADPQFDSKALEDLARTTGSDELDWGFPLQPNLEVRGAPQPNAPAIEKLGMHFVWVAMDESQTSDTMIRIVTPSGRFGFVPVEAISPLGGNQICYVKEPGGWRIAGFIGEQ